MNKNSKIWFIVASLLIVVGAIVCITCILLSGGKFVSKYDTKIYENLGVINDIDIDVDTADIKFVKSSDNTTKVVCYEHEKIKHTVEVVDGKLKINVKDDRKWYDFIGIGFESSSITVYLPNIEYGSLCISSTTGDVLVSKAFKFSSIDIDGSTGDIECLASCIDDININLSTGDILVKDVTATHLSLTVSTGEIEVENAVIAGNIKIKYSTDDCSLENVTGLNLSINGGTGDVDLENVIISNKMDISLSTGDVNFNKSDALEIKVEVSTGDVTGSLLSSKIFIVETSTGKKQVPKTTEGGICEITSTTGNIIISINK